MEIQHPEVLELERRFWTEGGGSPAFWRAHFADDGIVALGMGPMDKDDTASAMEQAEPWASVSIEDLREVEVAPGVVAFAYRATGHREGEADTYEAVVTSVYARRADDWCLVLHQQTPASGRS